MQTLITLLLQLSISQVGPSPEATLKSAIEDFGFGEHAKASAKLGQVLSPIQLKSMEDVILARQYLGACYHLTGDLEGAKREFSMLLALDSAHRLDPEVFSPALVRFFEKVRDDAGLGSKPRPPRKKKPPVPKVVVTPEPDQAKHSAAFAIIPFGVGQFMNEHPVRGALFAVAEIGLFTAAAVTFAGFENLKLDNGSFRPEDESRANTLQNTYLATFWTGIGVLAVGIIEALISYPGDAVLTPDAPSASKNSGALWLR